LAHGAELEKIIEIEIATSIITIVLGILSFFVFISYRAGALLFLLIAATLIVGLLNAWLISTIDERKMHRGKGPKAIAARPRRRTRRKKA
jgi:hypothetical protein